MKKLVLCVLLLGVSLLVGCGGGSSSGGGGTTVTLVAIQVTPASPSINLGATQQFKATGSYSDGSTKDLTATANWLSSGTSVATINTSGLANGVAGGTSSISATSGSISGATTLTVVALQSIAVTPSAPSVVFHGTQQFTATGTYSDGSTKNITTSVTWTASTGASITGGGLATGTVAGMSTITATLGTISGTAVLTVTNPLMSIAVTPGTATINPTAPGNTQQFTAMGTYASGPPQDITASVTWQSSNSSTAAISAAGLATAVAPGTVTVTATSGSVSGTASLTVTNPLLSIAVSCPLCTAPVNPSVALGTKPQFAATGTYFDNTTNIITAAVTWSSSKTSVATISNAPGLQGQSTAVAAGTTTITATLGSVSGSTTLTVTNATVKSIAVTPASAPISLNLQQQYTATGTFSDGSQQDITNVSAWTSSDTTKVLITTSGLATGIGVTSSPVTITATFKGVSGTATVTVNAANLLSIAIKPNNFTLAQGTSRMFTAIGTFNNGSTLDVTYQATWSSADKSIATVPQSGVVKASTLVPMSANPVTITVSLGSVTQQIPLIVTNATIQSLTVTPISATIPQGSLQLFSAAGTFSDGTTQDITQDAAWTSSAPAVATVTYPGRLLGNTAGTATITASFGGQSAPAQLTVTAVTLVSIAVTPATATLAPGSTMTFQATGTYSDGSMINLYPLAAWSSSAPAVVQVVATSGQATGQSAGSATLTATYQGVSGTANVLVTPSPLVSIAVTPVTVTVPAAVSTPFTAVGTFADSSTQNLTTSVTWSSSQSSIGTISNGYGHQGLATGVAPGTTNITAVFALIVSPPATLTVNTATLVSIAVTPSNPSVTHGTAQQFTAKGTFSDSSVIDLTNQASWASSNVSVATISAGGLASTANPGTTNITATFTQGANPPVSGTTVLTVN